MHGTGMRRSFMEIIRVLSRDAQFVSQGFMTGAAYTVGGAAGLFAGPRDAYGTVDRDLTRPVGNALQHNRWCGQDSVHLFRSRGWREYRRL